MVGAGLRRTRLGLRVGAIEYYVDDEEKDTTLDCGRIVGSGVRK